MRQFIFGFEAALLLIAAGGLGYICTWSGARCNHARTPAVRMLNARINRKAPKSSPIPASDETYAAGVSIYRKNCAVCHGLPGQAQTVIAKGEFPQPPELFKGTGVSNDPVGVT
jgi:mono/diheme cytochrome c family protein